jgi:hypothetical protein
MAGDDDDYGRRRADDYQYANQGNAAAPPTAIEKILLQSGMPQKEVGETATAIVTLMGKMTNDPLPQQQKMVGTFMGRHANPEAVTAITSIALDEVKEKNAFTLAPAGNQPAVKSSAFSAPKTKI